MFGCILTVAETYIMEAWRSPMKPHHMKKAMYWNYAVCLVSGLFLMCSNGRFKRMEHEAQQALAYEKQKRKECDIAGPSITRKFFPSSDNAIN